MPTYFHAFDSITTWRPAESTADNCRSASAPLRAGWEVAGAVRFSCVGWRWPPFEPGGAQIVRCSGDAGLSIPSG
eukprot:2410675-Pyramimonas_sp.AAC.1